MNLAATRIFSFVSPMFSMKSPSGLTRKMYFSISTVLIRVPMWRPAAKSSSSERRRFSARGIASLISSYHNSIVVEEGLSQLGTLRPACQRPGYCYACSFCLSHHSTTLDADSDIDSLRPIPSDQQRLLNLHSRNFRIHVIERLIIDVNASLPRPHYCSRDCGFSLACFK